MEFFHPLQLLNDYIQLNRPEVRIFQPSFERFGRSRKYSAQFKYKVYSRVWTFAKKPKPKAL